MSRKERGMRTCRVSLDLPYIQYNNNYNNFLDVLDFIRESGTYIPAKDELWLYPGTTQSRQIFLNNYVVKFYPVVFRVFSEAEFNRIFEPVVDD
jgi:hypothetical protein